VHEGVSFKNLKEKDHFEDVNVAVSTGRFKKMDPI
jgi:hypothetical protein